MKTRSLVTIFAAIVFLSAASALSIIARSATIDGNNLFSIPDSREPLLFIRDSTKFSFVRPKTVQVTNIEELYAAVNDPQNAGSQIFIAPGLYMLSANDPANVPRPNGGRIDLLENMSLQGVVGDRNAVVIDANDLPASSYVTPTISKSGAIRMGRGTNAVEWLTIRNAVNGNGGIETEIAWPGTAHIRIAHIISTGNPRGIGAQLRLGSGQWQGPVREVHAGGGYWSQDSAVHVLARPAGPAKLWVRWPGGETTSVEIPDEALEITCDSNGVLKRTR